MPTSMSRFPFVLQEKETSLTSQEQKCRDTERCMTRLQKRFSSKHGYLTFSQETKGISPKMV